MQAEEIIINESVRLIKASKAMLDGSYFDDISFKNVKITNANMSCLEIEGAQLGGAYIHNIGMPPQGHPLYDPEKKQLPLRFEDCNLAGTQLNNCNLEGVVLDNCNTTGMIINGIPLKVLLASYGKSTE